MSEETKIDAREQAIRDRMTQSLGALNRQQAEMAVDLQEQDDAQKAKDAKAAEAAKKKADEKGGDKK